LGYNITPQPHNKIELYIGGSKDNPDPYRFFIAKNVLDQIENIEISGLKYLSENSSNLVHKNNGNAFYTEFIDIGAYNSSDPDNYFHICFI
jgi:hypothetical protein